MTPENLSTQVNQSDNQNQIKNDPEEEEIDYAKILDRNINNPFIPIRPGTKLADLIGTPTQAEKPQGFVSSPDAPSGTDTPEGDMALIKREIRFREEKRKSRLERRKSGTHLQAKYRNGNG
jgi:hypothetical protein